MENCVREYFLKKQKVGLRYMTDETGSPTMEVAPAQDLQGFPLWRSLLKRYS